MTRQRLRSGAHDPADRSHGRRRFGAPADVARRGARGALPRPRPSAPRPRARSSAAFTRRPRRSARVAPRRPRRRHRDPPRRIHARPAAAAGRGDHGARYPPAAEGGRGCRCGALRVLQCAQRDDLPADRFFRAKALAEQRVAASALETTIFAPSIIYDRDDPWVTALRRLALLPVMPISGRGRSAYEPIWAQGRGLRGDRLARRRARPLRARRPRAAHLRADRPDHRRPAGRRRRGLHVPLPFVRSGLIWLRRLIGETAFATSRRRSCSRCRC